MQIARSHFGSGILTFPSSYLFRTDPGVGLWVRGIPNRPKDGIAPLEWLVETDWLDFAFTMNWQFTRPSCVTFEKDEPFCFITPIAYHALDDVTPEIIPIANSELAAKYLAYRKARAEFNVHLAGKDPGIVQQGWQKWYMRGEPPSGGAPHPLHLPKLRLAAPIVPKGTEVASVPEGARSQGKVSETDISVLPKPVAD